MAAAAAEEEEEEERRWKRRRKKRGGEKKPFLLLSIATKRQCYRHKKIIANGTLRKKDHKRPPN